MSDIVSTTSLVSLDPDSFVDLFEIYVDQTVGIFRFHAGKNFSRSIIFRGNAYIPVPVEFDGFEYSADGKQSRPNMRIANIEGYITDYIKNKNDLVNSQLKRIKIFVRNLDDANFSDNVNPFFGYRSKRNAVNGYGNAFYEDNFIINRKNQENKYFIEFSLSSPLDLENQSLPNRKISDNLCPWSYRGCGCNYGKIPWSPVGKQIFKIGTTEKTEAQIWGEGKINEGIPIADENNKEFYSEYGYNLTDIVDRKFYDKEVIYNRGDFVRYIDSMNYNFFGEQIQFSEDNFSYSFYVCIKTHGAGMAGVGAKNPATDKEYWVKDSCPKNLKACILRWQNHAKGLPYGGFPGTRPFEYSTL